MAGIVLTELERGELEGIPLLERIIVQQKIVVSVSQLSKLRDFIRALKEFSKDFGLNIIAKIEDTIEKLRGTNPASLKIFLRYLFFKAEQFERSITTGFIGILVNISRFVEYSSSKLIVFKSAGSFVAFLDKVDALAKFLTSIMPVAGELLLLSLLIGLSLGALIKMGLKPIRVKRALLELEKDQARFEKNNPIILEKLKNNLKPVKLNKHDLNILIKYEKRQEALWDKVAKANRII